MKYSEIATKTKSELYELLVNLKKDSFGIRVQKRLSENVPTAPLRANRRDVARILTRLGEMKRNNRS